MDILLHLYLNALIRLGKIDNSDIVRTSDTPRILPIPIIGTRLRIGVPLSGHIRQ